MIKSQYVITYCDFLENLLLSLLILPVPVSHYELYRNGVLKATQNIVPFVFGASLLGK
ncbi:MAG: hypothetical protein MR619_07495 [Eubacterium sp.]|nr:hypothetical protein [Eubacterium sp.]